MKPRNLDEYLFGKAIRRAKRIERKRIIEILDEHCTTTISGGGGIECWSCGSQDYDEHLIALIKGENK
jgi:hypothetical protein